MKLPHAISCQQQSSLDSSAKEDIELVNYWWCVVCCGQRTRHASKQMFGLTASEDFCTALDFLHWPVAITTNPYLLLPGLWVETMKQSPLRSPVRSDFGLTQIVTITGN